MTSIGLDELNTLIEINNRINSNYADLDALLVYILEAAMRLVHCESSSLLLVNADDTLRFVIALGPKGAEAKDIPVDKSSIAGWVASHRQPLILRDVVNDPRFSDHVQHKTGYVSKTMIAVPLCVGDECIGVIELINKAGGEYFDDDDLEILNMLCSQAGIAYRNAAKYQSAQNKISALQNTLSAGSDYHPFIAKSPVISDLLKMIDGIAKTNLSIIITGESGVGKELVAEQIHRKSDREGKPFVRVNCAALSPSLLESELFGHVKGAFTGARESREGLLRSANGGMLFLDEIGELGADEQAMLLKAIEEKTFYPFGSDRQVSSDFQLIAGTVRDLRQLVAEGKFREDLYARINLWTFTLPGLRQRQEDIEPNLDYEVERHASLTGDSVRFNTEARRAWLACSASAWRR